MGTPNTIGAIEGAIGAIEGAIGSMGAGGGHDFDDLQHEDKSPKRRRVSSTIASTMEGLASLEHNLAFEDSGLNLSDENTPSKRGGGT
jgi:hypothetical protein